MVRKNLIIEVSKFTNVDENTCQKILDAAFGIMGETLAREEKIQIPDFGVFETITSKPRNGYNPTTGEHIVIAEKKKVKFKPYKGMDIYKIRYCK